MFYTYVIKSTKSKWYYVGSTGDIEKRLKRHNNGDVVSTKPRRPYILVYSEIHSTPEQAHARERQIKKVRSIKEEIIRKYGPIV